MDNNNGGGNGGWRRGGLGWWGGVGGKGRKLYLNNKKVIYLFLEMRREGEREGGKHQCVVASSMHPPGDLAHNLGMCPDWELNQLPLASQADIKSTEPHQPRLIVLFEIDRKNPLYHYSLHEKTQAESAIDSNLTSTNAFDGD